MSDTSNNSPHEIQPSRAHHTGRRPRRPSLSSETLLKRVLELFFNEGYEGTSIDRVAAQIGIAKRSIYARFGDKKSLFLAALEQEINHWIVSPDILRTLETDNLEETLLRIGRLLLENILRPEGIRLLQLTNEVSRKMPEIAYFNVHYGSGPTIEYLKELFDRHIRPCDGVVFSTRNAAEAFLHLVVGGLAGAASWGIHHSRAEVDARLQFSVELFLHGAIREPVTALHHDARASSEEERAKLKKMLGNMADQLARTASQIDDGRSKPAT